MQKFKKMTVIGPTRFTEESKQKMRDEYAEEVIFFEYLPRDEKEQVEVIADSDAVLVVQQVRVTKNVIDQCPNLKYIGMCCSLYGPESANVDILAANAKGITVTGIRDYGDEGVVEYVISELVQLLHGFGKNMWKEIPYELTGQRVGILGMGTLGHLIGKALKFFGADVCYYSRTRKPDIEEIGVAYKELNDLMASVDICIGCLNKNVILLGEEQFKLFGHGKIMMNVGIGPYAEAEPLAEWLSHSCNWYLCDELWGLTDPKLDLLPNVLCVKKGAGTSYQLIGRYNKKLLGNIEDFLNK